jgi:hypothetical protein
MARSLQHLIIARALDIISDEARWTSLVIARTADGSLCDCRDVAAARFCAIGALYRASAEMLGEQAFEFVFRAEKFILRANNRPHDSLPRINDREGHAVIVAMFERALAG